VRMSDGGFLLPGRLERPFIYNENGEPTILSLPVKKGDDSYNIFIPVRPKVIPLPNARQLAWQEAEMGALFSYDLHVFDGKKYMQGINRITPIGSYQIFDPEHLDTDQWIKAAKEAGITFAILTVMHETGFALYQSDVNPYCMKALKYKDGKGDIVRDFVAPAENTNLNRPFTLASGGIHSLESTILKSMEKGPSVTTGSTVITIWLKGW